MTIANYDPKKISVIVGSQPIQGFAKGTFVKVSRDEDAFSLLVGADGETTRTKNANKAGKLVFTLLAASPSNDYLSSLALADELSGNSTFPVLVKDAQGTTKEAAATAWVTKTPDSEFSNEMTNREWTIQTDELVRFVGGTTVS